jgi:hypothetical protein
MQRPSRACVLTAPPAELVDAKLLTRATYSLSGMEGPVEADRAGAFTFRERDGMDYAAITLQARPRRLSFMLCVPPVCNTVIISIHALPCDAATVTLLAWLKQDPACPSAFQPFSRPVHALHH